jgi:arsenate reductase
MTTTPDTPEPIRLAFMCVRNAGRSQMATAFAERERDRLDLGDRVEIVTGGTHPADHVHEEVVAVMREEGVDIADRTPCEITTEELRSCEYVATMGCSTLDISDVEDAVDIREWDLPDPAGQDPEQVRAIRDEIDQRVRSLFEDVCEHSAIDLTTTPDDTKLSGGG